jgi:hypothetical protein
LVRKGLKFEPTENGDIDFRAPAGRECLWTTDKNVVKPIGDTGIFLKSAKIQDVGWFLIMFF